MHSLIAELIKRFGVWIILALILVVASVWFIVHSTAEPGEKVSIFFGLVEYTKGKSQIEPEPEPRPELEPETSWPRSPDGMYEATRVGSGNDWHYQITEIETGRLVLTTHAEYKTPNDVKAGLFIFTPDSRKIAAAYHYGHAGGYTWIRIWDIETGNILDTVTERDWTTDIYSVLREKRPYEYR